MTDDEFDAKAREIAHAYQPRCTGDTGTGAGGDAPRYHSNSCNSLTDAISTALRDAVKAEREACAKIAEAYRSGFLGREPQFARVAAAQYIRDEIRARSVQIAQVVQPKLNT